VSRIFYRGLMSRIGEGKDYTPSPNQKHLWVGAIHQPLVDEITFAARKKRKQTLLQRVYKLLNTSVDPAVPLTIVIQLKETGLEIWHSDKKRTPRFLSFLNRLFRENYLDDTLQPKCRINGKSLSQLQKQVYQHRWMGKLDDILKYQTVKWLSGNGLKHRLNLEVSLQRPLDVSIKKSLKASGLQFSADSLMGKKSFVAKAEVASLPDIAQCKAVKALAFFNPQRCDTWSPERD
jgi:hypothetical protein